MASSNTRQRKLARAKIDRRLTRQADRTRRSRQLKAAVGGTLAIAVAALGATWLLGGFDKKPVTPVADTCAWNPQDSTANADLKEVGTPTANGMPTTGTSALTIALNGGNVVANLDRAAAPCAAASFAFLAGKGFFNGTNCHELSHAGGVFALTCGDPSGTGNGGAAYTWFPENLPDPTAAQPTASPAPSAAPSPAATTVRYPKGTIAMTPSLSGSRFTIFYQDSTLDTAKFDIVGQVKSGIEVIEKIAKGGTVKNAAGADTKPKQDVKISTLTVVDPAATPPATTTTPTAPASTKPTPTVSASAAS